VTSELDRLAAACILPSFPGLEPPDWIRRWLERGLGGIVLFARNVGDPEQLQALTAGLRRGRPETLVAIDEEGGDVTRLEAATGSSYPGNLALGAVDDVSLTEEVAAAMASDLRRAGVTLNLAPVADVNTNPRNPVIGVRSFGSDPHLVARHVATFVEGTQRQGVAACAKHFPGHGDTTADSHLELPRVEADRDALLGEALVPFRAAIEVGVRAVMTAHVVVAAFDDRPATLSRPVLTGLLRGELGFDGMVVSDALDMRAVAATGRLEEVAVGALAAGVEALCLGPAYGAEAVARVHGGILDAVRSGRLPAERVADAARRVEATGRWASSAAAGDGNRSIGAVAAASALRAHGDVLLRSPPLVVELVPEPTLAAGRASYGLGDALRARRPDAVVLSLNEPPVDLRDVLGRSGGRRLVLVLRDASRHAWQQAVTNELTSALPDAVVVETGLPGWLPDGAAAWVVTHGAARVSLEAAADVLAG
jgi:beta-N-acetylhexosaminidase